MAEAYHGQDLVRQIHTLQEQLNEAIATALGSDLGQLVAQLIEVTRSPIQL